MAVISHTSGDMMNKWTQKVKAKFAIQFVEKVTPKIITGINVSDFTETPKSPLMKFKNNIVFKKSGVYTLIGRSRPIARLVNDAIKQLNERSGSSAKSIKRLIVFKHPNVDERLLGMQIKRYIKNSLINGAMIREKRTFKLKKKHGDRFKEWAREEEKALEQKMQRQIKEKVKVKKAGNNAYFSMPDKTNEETSDTKDEENPEKNPSPKCDNDNSAKEPEPDKTPKKVQKTLKPAGGRPTKTPVNKKTKPKKKAHKAINLSLRPAPPHPKATKKANVMSTVSNTKIRKLQQPMEKGRQNRAARQM